MITFNPLSIQIMEQIVDKFFSEVQAQVTPKKVCAQLSPAARNWLARNGFSPEYGARPLARLMQVEIKDALSNEILFGTLAAGGTVTIDLAPDADAPAAAGAEKRHLSFTYA
jgi:ATP-dependent Clp protease ATP-binding subunit ClpA